MWSFFIIASNCKTETYNFKRLISKNGNTADVASAYSTKLWSLHSSQLVSSKWKCTRIFSISLTFNSRYFSRLLLYFYTSTQYCKPIASPLIFEALLSFTAKRQLYQCISWQTAIVFPNGINTLLRRYTSQYTPRICQMCFKHSLVHWYFGWFGFTLLRKGNTFSLTSHAILHVFRAHSLLCMENVFAQLSEWWTGGEW